MSDKRMICRCEDVGEHDVAEAIDKGHRDLESVKRYTGLGTGWCQGKQCVVAACRAIERFGGDRPTAPITPRPPFHPIPLAHLAGLDRDEPEER